MRAVCEEHPRIETVLDNQCGISDCVRDDIEEIKKDVIALRIQLAKWGAAIAALASIPLISQIVNLLK